jgi:toxin ParE1/3/4
MSKRSLRFSAEASADFDDIVTFGLERFGRSVGLAYARGLRAACRRLCDQPGVAPYYPTVHPPARCLVHRSHRVFYRVEPERVLIVRILHHARAVPAAL